MQALLERRQPPEIEPGRHCHDPHGCEFWAHCTAAKPEDWIFNLPRLSEPRFQEFRAAGHERIRDLPDDAPLTAVQVRTREALRTGRPVVSRGLAQALRDFGPPAVFLDFETIFPAIPLYPGTSPYQQIPFQWSLHRLGARGQLTHREFLAEGREDPRRAFAESLIAAIAADDAPVVVYSHFEKSRLSELVEWLPALAEPLGAIIRRLADLLPVARRNVYHPEFGGSFSLKAVAPALVPDFGYDDLDEIADGGAASAAFVRIARGELEPDEEALLRRALLAYCARDTLALVRVQSALQALGLQHTP